MRWFGACGLFLKDIWEGPWPNSAKLIALFISIPCFSISNFCFQRAYLLNQIKLRRLCGEDLFLKLYDNPLPRGNVVSVLYGLQNIKRRLEGADPSKYLSDHIVSRPPNSCD